LLDSRKRKLGEDSPVKLDPPKFTVDAMDIDEDAASPNATVLISSSMVLGILMFSCLAGQLPGE